VIQAISINTDDKFQWNNKEYNNIIEPIKFNQTYAKLVEVTLFMFIKKYAMRVRITPTIPT
jgi:hypothetical protein